MISFNLFKEKQIFINLKKIKIKEKNKNKRKKIEIMKN